MHQMRTRVAVRFHNFKNSTVKHLEKYYKDINGMMYLTNANSSPEQQRRSTNHEQEAATFGHVLL